MKILRSQALINKSCPNKLSIDKKNKIIRDNRKGEDVYKSLRDNEDEI